MAAFTGRMQLHNRSIELPVGAGPVAAFAPSPLVVARARDLQARAPRAHTELTATPSRNTLPLFFTMSRSSLALANSRRSRMFFAWSSGTGRFAVKGCTRAAGSTPIFFAPHPAFYA